MREPSPIDAVGVTVSHVAVSTPDVAAAPVAPHDLDGAPTLPDYTITGRLGEGGMGVVWRATQLSTRREVALKLMNAAAFGSIRARRRFEREVELAARLEHPHVARVYDAGVHAGVSYYAMELVDGLPFDAFAMLHRLDRREILTIMRGVCEGVQHAHQRGVIHRDLKPSNILITPERRPVVLDFGLAKTLLPDDSGAPQVSIEGQVAGTPAYMSPEQAAGHADQVDTRSDVYSLGVILYRLLTGQSPHDLTGSSLDVLRRIASDEPKRPRDVSKDASRMIDRELETLLMKCLAKDPNRRYASAGALGQDIDNYLRGEPLLAKRPTATYVLRRRLHQHRVAASATLGVLVLLAGLGGGGAAWLYAQPVVLPVDSNPPGATIYLNGVAQVGCGVTPCRVKLPPGDHTVELRHPSGFAPAVRRVSVAWGRVTGDAHEPITMSPTFRTVVFDTEPAGIEFVLRRIDEPGYYTVRPPQLHMIPAGKYSVDLGGAAYILNENERELIFPPGLEPLNLTLHLTPHVSP